MLDKEEEGLSMKKRILASLLSVIMITTMIETVALQPAVANAEATNNLKNPVVTDKASTWDCIWFGNYYQSSSSKRVCSGSSVSGCFLKIQQ